MSTITIPRKEYEELVDKRLRYEYLRQMMNGDIFSAPPEKNIKKVLKEFRASKKYSQKFIKSLENGLKRSSYFK